MKKPLKRAYLEITNVCNLDCSFCHKTKRQKAFMEEASFRHAVGELSRVADYLYFHVMGEPLLHPKLADFLAIAEEAGMKVILTTNGTLVQDKAEELLSAPALHKISLSLHAYEANGMQMPLKTYLDNCLAFTEVAAKRGVIVALRLWNIGGKEALNDEIVKKLHDRFGKGEKTARNGEKLGQFVYLEWGDAFAWPDLSSHLDEGRHSCYGLRDQVAVLVDGSVLPCCLDADGVITLGNLFESPIEAILASERAVKLKTSFERRAVEEALCRKCDFALRRVK